MKTYTNTTMNTRLMKYIASTRPTVNGLATSQSVTDRRTDGTAANGDAATDERTGDAYCSTNVLWVCCHCFSFLLGWG